MFGARQDPTRILSVVGPVCAMFMLDNPFAWLHSFTGEAQHRRRPPIGGLS